MVVKKYFNKTGITQHPVFTEPDFDHVYHTSSPGFSFYHIKGCRRQSDISCIIATQASSASLVAAPQNFPGKTRLKNSYRMINRLSFELFESPLHRMDLRTPHASKTGFVVVAIFLEAAYFFETYINSVVL